MELIGSVILCNNSMEISFTRNTLLRLMWCFGWTKTPPAFSHHLHRTLALSAAYSSHISTSDLRNNERHHPATVCL